MHVHIAANGDLSLRDSDNFSAFSIVEAEPGSAAARLSSIATPGEDGRYWFDAHAVIELSGRNGDENWVKQFWAMLAAAEPYGFSDLKNRKVKAHVESAAC